MFYGCVISKAVAAALDYDTHRYNNLRGSRKTPCCLGITDKSCWLDPLQRLQVQSTWTRKIRFLLEYFDRCKMVNAPICNELVGCERNIYSRWLWWIFREFSLRFDWIIVTQQSLSDSLILKAFSPVLGKDPQSEMHYDVWFFFRF